MKGCEDSLEWFQTKIGIKAPLVCKQMLGGGRDVKNKISELPSSLGTAQNSKGNLGT